MLPFTTCQLSEVLKQGPLTKIILNFSHSAKTLDYQSNATYKAETERLMQSAIDMYRQMWPAFKHKLPFHSSIANLLGVNQFFSLTVRCMDEFMDESIAIGGSMTTCFQGRLSMNELDWNAFEEAREHTMADGTRSSSPSVRHTVR